MCLRSDGTYEDIKKTTTNEHKMETIQITIKRKIKTLFWCYVYRENRKSTRTTRT